MKYWNTDVIVLFGRLLQFCLYSYPQIYYLKHEWHEWISTLLSYCERSGDGGGNPNSPLCELNPSESIGLNKMKVIWYQKEENEVCSAVNNSKPNYFMILYTRLIFNFYSYVCFYFNNALLCVLIETINYLKLNMFSYLTLIAKTMQPK